jgi:hypothetical protein
MEGFDQLAEYCVDFFKKYNIYHVNNIFIDGVEYKLFITKSPVFYHCVIKLRPTFTNESHYLPNNSDVYICATNYCKDGSLHKQILIDLFEQFKTKLKNIYIALDCETERQTYTGLCQYDKTEYQIKLDFLKELGLEGTCYICHNSTLNTEHTSGCRHPIHLSCLYQMSRRFPKYVCGICKKTTDWNCLFDEPIEENE